MKDSNKKNKNYQYSYARLVALSFIILIAIGTTLLMLPISSKNGSTSFVDALFTATSASCVTGLVIFDTFSKWTLFGQIVILCMIQIGGLGFITIVTMLSRIIKKRISLTEKLLLKESVGTIYKGELKSLVNVVISLTILFEVSGAVILATQYIPEMGFKNGLYTAVFLSVSAFCNAGFDVMGRVEAGSSLMTVNDNPVIILTISALIIIGGIGFIVWDDIIRYKSRFNKYSLHSKLALVTTAVLLILGAIFFTAFEWNNTLSNMPVWQKVLNGFFASVTPRTAGFNSIPTGDMTGISKTFTYLLMFIGGSSASTAGGIKTTSFAILFLCAFSTLASKKDVEAFGRRITPEAIRKAAAIITINLTAIFSTVIIITLCQPEFKCQDIIFECFSAIGTVGMTTGITPLLTLIPKLLITVLMFVGRITSLVFAFSIFSAGKVSSIKKPTGNILIG